MGKIIFPHPASELGQAVRNQTISFCQQFRTHLGDFPTGKIIMNPVKKRTVIHGSAFFYADLGENGQILTGRPQLGFQRFKIFPPNCSPAFLRTFFTESLTSSIRSKRIQFGSLEPGTKSGPVNFMEIQMSQFSALRSFAAARRKKPKRKIWKNPLTARRKTGDIPAGT